MLIVRPGVPPLSEWAIALAPGVLVRMRAAPLQNTGVAVRNFDEERFGTADLPGLIDREMAGMGDAMALWPARNADEGELPRILEGESMRSTR